MCEEPDFVWSTFTQGSLRDWKLMSCGAAEMMVYSLITSRGIQPLLSFWPLILWGAWTDVCLSLITLLPAILHRQEHQYKQSVLVLGISLYGRNHLSAFYDTKWSTSAFKDLRDVFFFSVVKLFMQWKEVL